MATHSTSPDQQRFIGRLQQALADGAGDRRPGRPGSIYRKQGPVKTRSRPEQLALLDRLVAESAPINQRVAVHPEAASVARGISELVAEKDPEWGDEKHVVAWRHPLVEALSLPDVLQGVGASMSYAASAGTDDRETVRQQIFKAYVGITSADFCLADSATLVMKSRPGQNRSVSLVPSIHIAVIRLEQILANLKELYYILDNDPVHVKEGLTPCMTFVSGPSKTADIEATMVHGAHGPREVHLFVITG
ncbi:MAG: LUD domain-containing protein [Deltaproteobacteria bacterium]|nr:LUD domain-containing protein [Deltaproteobacteria bacterium]